MSTAENCSAALSSVTLDWSKLKTKVLPIAGNPAPTFSLSGQSTHISTNAFSSGDGSESFDHSVPNWSDARNFTAHTTNADGNASASSSSISLSTSATAPIACCGSNSNSSVDRSAGFSLSGPGALIFSVPYTLATSGTPFDFSDFSSLSINGSASFFNFGSSTSTSGDGSTSIFADSNSPISTSGTLTFGLVASSAGTGSVDFSVFTSASNGILIPEPSPLLGLLAGLGAVIVVSTRRVGNANLTK